MKMNLAVEPYLHQQPLWPSEGRHILAQFDDESVVVYQAYSAEIGHFAAAHGYFGGGFSYTRMSWIKTNFLWMMYRSGWGSKAGQEVALAVRLRRGFFDSLLEQAVPSSFDRDLYPDTASWSKAVARSGVRLQWDPDHGPSGQPRQRRAIQLGLRGPVLEEYGKRAILEIEDISEFVAEQHSHVRPGFYEELMTPSERVYLPADPQVAQRLRLSAAQGYTEPSKP
jgi:hypothetical protein